MELSKQKTRDLEYSAILFIMAIFCLLMLETLTDSHTKLSIFGYWGFFIIMMYAFMIIINYKRVKK